MQITLDTYNMTGLTGTLGYAIYNADHTEFQARKTTGITEFPPGSGAYQAEEDAETLAGRLVIWDTGGVSPLYAQEFFATSLDETKGAVITRSLRTLAHEASQRYSKGEYALWQTLLREAWRQFVHRCDWVSATTHTLTLVDGQRVYELPYDFKRMRRVVLELTEPKELTLTDEATVMEEAGWNTDEDEVAEYYFPDASHIAFIPVPDGVENEVTLYYFAEAPSEIDLDVGLAVPAVYERGLIAYATAEMAEAVGDSERDDIRAARERKRWEQVIADWHRDVGDRTAADLAIKPRYEDMTTSTEDANFTVEDIDP